MHFNRLDFLFFLPLAFVGCVICAFPLLVAAPAEGIYYKLTNNMSMTYAHGIIAWLVIAGGITLTTIVRACHVMFKLRPFHLVHIVYFVLSLYQVVTYIAKYVGPLSRMQPS